jgi:hypothetical protein
MQSNWFCAPREAVSATPGREPALRSGPDTHLADRQVFDGAQLVACARGRIGRLLGLAGGRGRLRASCGASTAMRHVGTGLQHAGVRCRVLRAPLKSSS